MTSRILFSKLTIFRPTSACEAYIQVFINRMNNSPFRHVRSAEYKDDKTGALYVYFHQIRNEDKTLVRLYHENEHEMSEEMRHLMVNEVKKLSRDFPNLACEYLSYLENDDWQIKQVFIDGVCVDYLATRRASTALDEMPREVLENLLLLRK